MSELLNNTILIVEDDLKLANLISEFLTSNGFDVKIESNGINAISIITEQQPKAVILDVMLPGSDGLSVCRAVRPLFNGPILMLTAMSDDIDEVAGLETGADDYLTKPVKPRVLLAHLRALLRRIEPFSSSKKVKSADINDAGPLVIDHSNRSVSNNVQTFHLTTAEYNLLWLLAEQSGKVVSREELHQKTFRLEYDGTDRSIDLRISRLRKKLGDNPKSPYIIKTIRGEGYLLTQ